MPTNYRVIQAHTGPDRPPLHLRPGERVTLGRTYDGPEGWPDWIWGESGSGVGAWVPLPVLEKAGDGTALARVAYDSTELEAREGDEVQGREETCGWVWCVRDGDRAAGWLPREKLEAVK